MSVSDIITLILAVIFTILISFFAGHEYSDYKHCKKQNGHYSLDYGLCFSEGAISEK